MTQELQGFPRGVGFLRDSCLAIMTLGSVFTGFDSTQAFVQNRPESKQPIRVQVEMVSLPVFVTSKDKKGVKNLRKEDFQVFEDGVPQVIAGFAATDTPISVLLALDTSGSTEVQFKRIQDEAIRFSEQLRPSDPVAVLSFANDITLQEDFNLSRDKNAQAIRSARVGGSTALYEAVYSALHNVLEPIGERKALVIFTDGVDTRSQLVTADETLELADRSDATIYSIYFNTEKDRKRPPGLFPPIGHDPHDEQVAGRGYLGLLSQYTGGQIYDATNVEDLVRAFSKIAAELANQYSIGYYPTNSKHDGQFRKVEVRVNRPGFIVRTKQGYFAQKDRQSCN